jgi:hypothetical protein
MALPEAIRGPKVLVAEGRDAVAFFRRVGDSLGLTDLQVIDFGSVSELRRRLLQLPNVPDFPRIEALGIIRDAETDPDAAFRSVSGALQRASLPVPPAPGQMVGNRPRVGIFILPDATTRGSLETLLLRTIATDPAVPCIDAFFACLEQQTAIRPANQDKARVHAFLASRADPAIRSGQAFDAGYWPQDSPAFEPIKGFLRGL